MKNKIVISIGSLLACIASIAVLIAAVGPPPILRNSMTTNQNVWEKSGSSMTWTGTVSSAGVMSAGTTGTASTNLASYGQLLGAITNGINQVITGGTNQTYGTENFVNSNGVVNALGPFSSATTATQSSNLVTLAQLQASSGSPAGSDTQVQFNKTAGFGADANFVWDYTNHRLGLGVVPQATLESGGFFRINDLGSIPSTGFGLELFAIQSQTNAFISSFDRGLSLYRTLNVFGNPVAINVGGGGNVGIGTSVPQSILSVNGGVAIGTYAGSVAAPANGLAVSGIQTNGSNIGIAGVYQAGGLVGITTSAKVIIQGSTTNLMVWQGGILVSNITNYHD